MLGFSRTHASLLVLAVAAVLSACGSTSINRAPVEDRGATVSPSVGADGRIAGVKQPPGFENAGKPGYYAVKPGETLIRIGLETGQNHKDIIRWNALDNPDKSYDVWQPVVATAPDHEPDKESLVVFLLDTRLRPYAWHRVSLGTVSDTSAHPREILRPVIAGNAHGFVIMHNHPSGDPSPSRADELVTRRIVEAAQLMQVQFLDHAIIGRPAPGRSPYYSFREGGIVP